ncbi:MAG: 23S rRNA (adenine(2503)-C(2))-methyltransferase RlmN [Bacteroidales bacterium]|nr:23S rRNA (adenine(2503)-C(2))-methyltransferase RlmN [Bacteroidales bacterium]
MKEALLGKTLDELRAVAAEAGLPAYSAGQMARWLYVRHVGSIDAMTDLSKAARAALSERYEVGGLQPAECFTSADGTRKYLFSTSIGSKYIETVMIPEYEDGSEGGLARATVCVSSQIGCKMNCSFCMTGRGGFHGHLTAAEILSQLLRIDEADELTNAVFMGMGEPLDNWPEVSRALEVITADWGLGWSPKRVTVSTIGVLPSLRKFLDGSRCHLAVSLHDPFPGERASLMPVQKAFPLQDVLAIIRRYDFTGQRRVSFEYTMFSGVNDSPAHADALARLLRGIPCRVNLIRFHSIPDSPLRTSSPEAIAAFQARLRKAGLTTTLRASRGEDIMAACGLLAGRGLKKTENDKITEV